MVVANDDAYLIVGDGGWWPGTFAAYETAERAERDFTPEQITALAARLDGRPATDDDLDALAEEASEPTA